MATYKFSANTGYLWRELPFVERIGRAAACGFDGLEFHDEVQSEDRAALGDALAEAALPIMSLNVRIGDTFGCAAVPGLSNQARADIDHAIEAADFTGAGAIHVLAGRAEGPAARDAYLENLQYALDGFERTILIEPICRAQVPGYFLSTVEQAAAIIAEIGHPRLRIMFDCYHVYQQDGAVLETFRRHAALIGHVQISAAEDRAEPFPGMLDYRQLLPEFKKAGYDGAFGCEYRPAGNVEDGLHWRDHFAASDGIRA